MSRTRKTRNQKEVDIYCFDAEFECTERIVPVYHVVKCEKTMDAWATQLIICKFCLNDTELQDDRRVGV